MKSLLCALLVSLTGSAAQAAKGSAGLVLAVPEIVGVYGSFWPTEDFSIDARLTLSTVEAGVTGHILMADTGTARHDLLVTGMGGYVHDLVNNGTWHAFHGPRVLAAVGYGCQVGWDIRLLAGVTAQQMLAGWGASFTAYAMLGHSF